MAYKRRASKIITKAQQRAADLKAIDPNFDLGSGLSAEALNEQIAAAQTILDDYNTLLARADAAGNDLKAVEKNLSTLSSRILTRIAGEYGKDSSEYEMAGGTRASEIRRSSKPKKTAA